MSEPLTIHHISFSGSILERGFWLYIWRIRSSSQEFFYVGRTGDNSSRFAASPFSRLGQHLDVRPTATANMLLRHIRRMDLDPLACNFELMVLGPLFPEQPTLELHRKFRDRIAPLEAGLATYLRAQGRKVVGSHASVSVVDIQLLSEVKRAFDEAIAKNDLLTKCKL